MFLFDAFKIKIIHPFHISDHFKKPCCHLSTDVLIIRACMHIKKHINLMHLP